MRTRRIRDWLALCDGTLAAELERIHGLDGLGGGSSSHSQLSAKLGGLYRSVLRTASERLGAEAEGFLVRAPARVNLMGMHSDHRGGSINPIAMMETLVFVHVRDDDRVVLVNTDPKYPDRSFAMDAELPAVRIEDWEAWTRERYAERAKAGTAGDWSDYVKAALLYYRNRCKGLAGQAEVNIPGMDLIFGSIVPAAAGLSSSSAMVVAAFLAVLHATGGKVEREALIDWCGDAEWYVGTRGGKGDHASIICGEPASVLHLAFFPTRIRAYPLPPGTAIVMAHSRVEAKKSKGARDFFNQRIAGYVIGERLLKQLDPARYAGAPNLAGCTPRRGAYPEAELLELLKRIPENMSRSEALRVLPEARDDLERIFDSHAEPAEGYEVRKILLFGLAEIERSDRAPEALERGDVAGFGELMKLSHEGDRIVRHEIAGDGSVAGKTPTDHRVPDALLARWLAEKVPLWRIPGGYDASIEETDLLVDLALAVEGVHGARLIGAGRGGCVGVLCRREAVDEVLKRLRTHYYLPRKLDPDSVFVASPCQGAGVLAG